MASLTAWEFSSIPFVIPPVIFVPVVFPMLSAEVVSISSRTLLNASCTFTPVLGSILVSPVINHPFASAPNALYSGNTSDIPNLSGSVRVDVAFSLRVVS